MTTLEMAIAKIKKLPTEQRNEVIKFVEFLEFKAGTINNNQEEISESKTQDWSDFIGCMEAEEKEFSFSEVAKEFIGCLDSNLEDLSYNPKYMEGFGK